MPVLYQNEQDCSACGACVNVCPKQVIVLKENERGFLFPVINGNKCINCNRCVDVCRFRSSELENKNTPDVYAVKNKDTEDLHKSASGGAFSAMARYMLDQGGMVFGCAFDENIIPRHICIEGIDNLQQLQGSKYVQSNIGTIYREVKLALENGRRILFSGTPCQCDALRSYLGKDYESLLCVELICHGVPSASFFREYLNLLEKKLKGKIIDISFRDKKRGWGALLHITYKNANGKTKHKYLSTGESYYYYYYYWGGNLYRESCYNCKYACLYRQSDYTIGDYWGVQKSHPEIDVADGVSVLLVNTNKGKKVLPELDRYMCIVQSDIQGVLRENGQLISPSKASMDSSKIWNLYMRGGSYEIEKNFQKNFKKQIITGKIKRLIPYKIKKYIKNILMK